MRTMKQVIKPKDRAVAIKVLIGAKRRIKDGKSDYVCYALDGAAVDQKESEIADKIQTHIMRCLGAWCFVTSWLQDQPGWSVADGWNRQQCNEYRMAWIDQMIKDLQ